MQFSFDKPIQNPVFHLSWTAVTSDIIIGITCSRGDQMANINYIATDGKDLELIAPLREKTRQYHVERSTFFKKRITEISVQDTNKQLLTQSTGGILLDLANDSDTEQLIGYCLTGINNIGHGEILSIYLEPEYRRHHCVFNIIIKKHFEIEIIPTKITVSFLLWYWLTCLKQYLFC